MWPPATLTWNQNGTLRQVAITDGFNSGGAQTCTFGSSTVSGYDDLGRLVNANCGSAWSQSFGYDQFGNISKSGSLNWACMTCYNGNNQYNTVLSASIRYDANGNLLNDTFHTYTWDAYGHPSTIDSTTCGSNGTCLTYDALGRMVEKSVNNIYTEVLYSPVGKTAVMSGQTSSGAYFPLPGGAVFNQLGTGSRYFWHKDWLGSVRFASTIGNRASYFDRAFAPFGETYNNFGATTGNSFTGDTQDTISGTYDTPNRELNPSQGRWISPDPAGLGAVDFGNPQSWNRYAYALNNPLIYTDPLGLFCVWDDGSYDAGDDPQSGNPEGCEQGLGGHWFDGLPSDYGLTADWSGQANEDFATRWLEDAADHYTLRVQVNAPLPNDGNDSTLQLGTANNGSWWSALKRSPWVVSWILPLGPIPGVAGVGPAGSFAWNPATKTLCGSIGAGASVGDNLAAGPVTGRTLSGQQATPSQINQIFGGWSISGGINVPIGPVPVGPGVQGSANGSGAVYGPTVGVAGASVSSTYAVCASF